MLDYFSSRLELCCSDIWRSSDAKRNAISQGNGPVCQVGTSPEILRVYKVIIIIIIIICMDYAF
jgi:hypothetical protein